MAYEGVTPPPVAPNAPATSYQGIKSSDVQVSSYQGITPPKVTSDVSSMVTNTKPTDTSNLFSNFLSQPNVVAPKTTTPSLQPATQFDGMTKPSQAVVLPVSNKIQSLPTTTISETKEGKIQDLKTQSPILDTQAKELADMNQQITEAKDKVDSTNQKSIDKFNSLVNDYNVKVSDYQTKSNIYNSKVKDVNSDTAIYQKPNSYQNWLIDGGNTHPINSFTNYIGGAIDDAQNKVSNLLDSLGNPKTPVSERMGLGVEATLSVANLAITPILAIFDPLGLAAFTAITNTPGIKNAIQYGTDKIEKGSTFLFDNLASKGIISKTTASNLEKPVADLASFIAQVAIAHGISSVATSEPVKEKINDIKTTLTKDVITQNFPGKSIYFNPKEVFSSVQSITSGNLDYATEAGLSSEDVASLKEVLAKEGYENIKDGKTIKIDPRTLVTLEDKPYWAKIKQYFGFDPSGTIVKSDTGLSGQSTVRGLLTEAQTPVVSAQPEQEIHPVLKDEINTALTNHGEDATHEALQTNLGVSHEMATQLLFHAKSPSGAKETSSAVTKLFNQVIPKESITSLPVEKISSGLTPEIESKINLEDPKIKQMIIDIKAGKDMPPIPVYQKPDGTYELNKDGGGRLAAYREAGIERIPVKVEDKTTLTSTQKQTLERSSPTMEAGFVKPGEVVEGVQHIVAKSADYIKQTNENISFAKNLDDTLFKAQKNAEADTIVNHQLQAETARTISQEEREHILDYRDKSEAGLKLPELTEKEKTINDKLITPLYEDSAQKIAYIKNAGVPFSSDNYSHRIAKNKGNPLDKIIAKKNKLFEKGAVVSNKNILKKSASALKHREMFSATNMLTGERTVVHIPGNKEGKITGFKDKKLSNFGEKKQIVTPRTKEFFDEHVTPVLNKVAKDLGIVHKTIALEGNKAGLSAKGKKLIVTHPGAPERVLIHEIGHQVDEKYGMQELFSKDDARNYGRDTMKDEQRAVADLVAGSNPKPSFKAYTRKGAEKIAQLFEAYLHVPEQFKEVAPNLYEKFDEFLRDHKELAPIRDIEPSLEMGIKKTGGEHIAGIKRGILVHEGNQYKIGQSTIAEIEQHSNVEYYHDPITAALFAHDDITRAFRAVQTLENLKNNPLFEDRTFKAGEGLPPEGWKTVNLDQFRGIFFEPETANVLNAFANDMKTSDDPIKYLSAINNFLLNTMFLSPVKHLLNVGTSAVINRGATRWLNPLAYPVLGRTTIDAIRSVIAKDDDYIKILRAGAPMMAAKADQAAYRADVLSSLGESTDKIQDLKKNIIKYGGAITPFHWAHALTWPGNDMILQQQIREELAKQGLTVKEATDKQIENVINQVTKILPSYRLPVTVRRVPRYITKNTLLFASYRYNLVKSFFNLAKTIFTGDAGGAVHYTANADGTFSQSYFSKQEWQARGQAVNKVLVMAFLSMIAMPYIDKKLKEFTGNNNAYLSDPGQISVIDNANKLANGEINLAQYIQTMVDLPPGTKELLQQFATNNDWFTGKTIQQQGTPTLSLEDLQQRITHAEGTITPFDLTQKISGGTMTIGQLLEAQIGIHTPKGNSLVNILQGSSSSVLSEIDRLNKTAHPPSSMNIEKRPDVMIFKSEVTPDKYNQAINQFTGLFVSNVEKLMNGQYIKPATTTTIAHKMDYQGATDEQKSAMIDTVKNQTISIIEKAYHYNKGQGTTGKAVFEGQTTKYGIPTIENLSRVSTDDGEIASKNIKGEPLYKRFSVAESSQIKSNLFNQDNYWKDNGYTEADTQLDHIVPIEAGGTMSKNNLMLISNVSDQLNQAFEDYIGAKYKAGTISRANAIKASVDYKINRNVSLDDIKNGKY